MTKLFKKTLVSVNKLTKAEEFKIGDLTNSFNILMDITDCDQAHMDRLSKNSNFCRYSDIKPFKDNQVLIPNKFNKFINASWINCPELHFFIATQGPLKSTIEHFWDMCIFYDVRVIVMLCGLNENGKEKCANYWSIDDSIEFHVDVEEISEDDYLIERKLTIVDLITNKIKVVNHIQFLKWPDHGIPNINETFYAFNSIINKVNLYKNGCPIVVHCSAGVGRTGTFITMYNIQKEILEQIENKEVSKIQFSIFNLVRKLKEMRFHMVQNIDQYTFIHQYITLVLNEFNKK